MRKGRNDCIVGTLNRRKGLFRIPLGMYWTSKGDDKCYDWVRLAMSLEFAL